ncbi:MAG: hypothetical protein RL268_2381 [Pseudomonadota bacterium]
MRSLRIAAIALGALALSGCVTPVGPVQVTRFHTGDLSQLGRGTITVEPAPGSDAGSLEWQTYRGAVMHELVKIGYTEAAPGSGAQVALMRVARSTYQPDRSSGPVSVGVGGSTGSYGSGVGVGVGIDLSPKPKALVDTELAVSIRERTSSKVLWEGRAGFTVGSGSPLATTGLAAPKMAQALFQGFPGNSGETIEVR